MMMGSLEQEYYEHEGFWEPSLSPLGDLDFHRVQSILSMIPRNVFSLLDVGCGNGLFCNLVKERRARIKVVGFDRSKTALKYVKTEKVSGDVTALPWPDGSFDCVSALEVLEHLPLQSFERAKQEISRVARDHLLVSVPNNQDLERSQTQCPACKTKFDPDLHMRSFNIESLRELFSELGFQCTRVEELGRYCNFVGHQYYTNVLRPRELGSSRMASPLCPLCGFRNDAFLEPTPPDGPMGAVRSRNPLVSAAKRVIKSVWPKAYGSRWIAAVYRRV
jgi:SAM-dependent methyltransferase